MCGRPNGRLGLTSLSTTGNALISLWGTEHPRRCGAAADGNDGPDAHGKSPWTTNCCCPPPSPNRLDNRLLRLPTGPWTTLRIAHLSTALTAAGNRSILEVKIRRTLPNFGAQNIARHYLIQATFLSSLFRGVHNCLSLDSFTSKQKSHNLSL